MPTNRAGQDRGAASAAALALSRAFSTSLDQMCSCSSPSCRRSTKERTSSGGAEARAVSAYRAASRHAADPNELPPGNQSNSRTIRMPWV